MDIFTARGEVLLSSKGAPSDQSEITKRVTEAPERCKKNLLVPTNKKGHLYGVFFHILRW